MRRFFICTFKLSPSLWGKYIGCRSHQLGNLCCFRSQSPAPVWGGRQENRDNSTRSIMKHSRHGNETWHRSMEPLHIHTANQTLTKRLAAELQHGASVSQMGAAPTAQPDTEAPINELRLRATLHLPAWGELLFFTLSSPPALSRIPRASPALQLPAGCGAAPAKQLRDEVEVEGF